MQVQDKKFEQLVALIKEVKPSVANKNISLDDSVVETLGLDSLDLLQLARKIQRKLELNFDLDRWQQGVGTHNYSVRSILDGSGNALNG